MQLTQFHTLRSGVQANASPSKGQALIALESILRDRLMGSGLFDTVEVEHTHDTDRLLAGLLQFRRTLDEEQVAVAVDRIWREVAYPFWEVHSTRAETDFVELQGATREAIDGPYTTVHVIAEKSTVPSQRGPLHRGGRA